jgi:nucleoside-diphosphate-sugar epimerase
MALLVTGSAGHLGEALMRTLFDAGHEAIGIDIKKTAFTHEVGSITDRNFVKKCMPGVQELRTNAAAVARRRVPRYEGVYASRGWSMFPSIERLRQRTSTE